MPSAAEFEEICERLRARGLMAWAYPQRHEIRVFRHPDVPGNRRVGSTTTMYLSLDPVVEVTSDAPFGWLSPVGDGGWLFTVATFQPTGPGDHQSHHDAIDAAIDDVVDYYFGDPTRMCEAWDAAVASGQITP